MGTASVSCAPPCVCTALESLDAYVPRERVSVTRLRAVRLQRGGGGGGGSGGGGGGSDHSGECVLRITTHRGPISRGEVYAVNSLILSSAHAGPGLSAHELVGIEEVINLAERP